MQSTSPILFIIAPAMYLLCSFWTYSMWKHSRLRTSDSEASSRDKRGYQEQCLVLCLLGPLAGIGITLYLLWHDRFWVTFVSCFTNGK